MTGAPTARSTWSLIALWLSMAMWLSVGGERALAFFRPRAARAGGPTALSGVLAGDPAAPGGWGRGAGSNGPTGPTGLPGGTEPGCSGCIEIAHFSSVGCGGPSACTAVGAGFGGMFGEDWNGSSWGFDALADPDSDSRLNGVWCTSATACTAVGVAGGELLAETGHGTSWTARGIPPPADALAASLNQVSCSSASACTAVGSYTTAGGAPLPLVERWNGTAWAVQSAPVSPGNEGAFNYVWCTTATACMAVGWIGTATRDEVPWAEAWNGSSWTPQPVQEPSDGEEDAVLNGVSCSSTTDCQAVGVVGPAAFAEHWNGSSWTLEATPGAAGGFTALNSVSCVSSVRCTAVGETDAAPLAEAWNGSRWTLQATPSPSDVAAFGVPPSVVLDDVACPAANSCVAVGSYRDSAQLIVTLSEHWNGARWTIDRTLNPQPPLVLGPVRDAEGNGGGSFCWVCFGKSLIRMFVGAPVDSADGNMYETSTDISIPGRSTPLAVSRTYNADAASAAGPLGHGWSTNLGASLQIGADTVTFTEENGAQTAFTLANGAWSAPPRDVATLRHEADGSWTLVRQAQQTLTFDSSGRLTAAADRNGYTTTYAYAGGVLTTVTDSSGRDLVLGYTGDLLTSVTDPNVAPARVVRYRYDGNADLTDVIDVDGGDTHYVYDSRHRMTAMLDPSCEAAPGCPGIRTGYDDAGRVASQSDQLGRTTTFAYAGDPTSALGGTTTITDPKGNVTVETYQHGVRVAETKGYGTGDAATTTFLYDPATARPTQITDPNGETTTLSYDDSGNVLARVDPLGRRTTWTYNSFNQPVTVTDPLNVTTTSTYDARGNLLSVSRPLTGTSDTQATRYAYDDPSHPGDVTAMIDPDGGVWTYGYDAQGDRTSTTDPLGDRRTSTYDGDGFLRATVTPRGNAAGADPAAYRTSYGHDAFGDVVTTRDQLGHVTTTTYDADRNLTSSTDPDGHTTTYGYDSANERTTVRRADGTTLRTTYWPDGSVRSQTDGAGHTTSYQYDPLARPASVTDALGRTTEYAYDPAGNETSTTDPQGRVTQLAYDAADELTGISYGDPGTPDVRDITYDADGQRTGQVDGSGAWAWAWDSLHRMTAVDEGAGGTVGFGYDLRGHPIRITYPGGRSVTRGYDAAGRWTSVTDWLGQQTTFGYDPDGNLTTETLPAATGIVDRAAYAADDTLASIDDTHGQASVFAARYSRDANRLLTGDSSAPAAASVFGYTPTNQLCYAAGAAGTCASPPAGATVYGYDGADNPTQLGATTQTFDAADELTSADPPPAGPSQAAATASRAPAAVAGPVTATPPVPLPRVTSGRSRLAHVAVVSRSHRTLSQRLAIGRAGDRLLAFVSAATPARGRERVAAISGAAAKWSPVTTTASRAGLLAIWQARAPKAVAHARVVVRFRVGGRPAALAAVALDPGAVVAARGHASGRRGAARARLRVPAASLVMAVGRVARAGARLRPLARQRILSRAGAPGSTSWLETGVRATPGGLTIGVGSPRSVRWGFAAVGLVEPGARSTEPPITPVTAPSPATPPDRRLAFTYDQEGDRTGVTGGGAAVTYRYNQARELTGAGPDVSYTYNADGVRMSKAVGARTSAFAWDLSGRLPTLLTDAGAAYVYGPGGLPLEQVSGSGTLWYHHDQLGSTRALTDAAGRVLATTGYDAYGNPAGSSGAVTTPFQYAGQYRDDETGFYYLRARYYDPSTAQFLSVDPRGAAAQQPYAYANDSPVNRTDPTGQDASDPSFHNALPPGYTGKQTDCEPFMSSYQISVWTIPMQPWETPDQACLRAFPSPPYHGQILPSQQNMPPCGDCWNQGEGQMTGGEDYWGGGMGCVGPFINGAEFIGGELSGGISELLAWFLRLCQGAEIAHSGGESLIGPCGVP